MNREIDMKENGLMFESQSQKCVDFQILRQTFEPLKIPIKGM